MTMHNISSTESTITPSNTSLSSLNVGTLMIAGRSYTVTIESSDPLVSSPQDSTKEKIQFLANLHLNYLQAQRVDLSKIVIQQLDEEGLSYVNDEGENLDQKSLPSSEIEFTGFKDSNPFAALYYPPSLQDSSISNISDIYRSIIDPLIFREVEAQKEETIPTSTIPLTSTKKFGKRVIFTLDPEETLVKTPINSDHKIKPKVENHSNSDISNASSKIEDQSSNEASETTNLKEAESTSRLARLLNWVRSKSNSSVEKTDVDMIDVKNIVEKDRILFLQQNPQALKYIKDYGEATFA